MASDVTPEAVRRFAAIFAGNLSSYGQYQLGPAGEKKVRTCKGPLPPDIWVKHLSGDGPFLGVVPIREDNTCYWGAIDIDDDAIDHDALEQAVLDRALPLVVCRSKSGGAHVFCFLTEPVPAPTLIDALKRFRALLGHEKNANGMPVEIFPKQTSVAVSGGNWLNLPYYDHAHTARYAVLGGEHLDLEGFFALVLARAIDAAALAAYSTPAAGPFADGPLCLQELHAKGFPEGARNTGLLNVGLYFQIRFPSAWEAPFREYHASLPSPLPEEELRQIIRNLGRHNYVYGCHSWPLDSVWPRKDPTKCPMLKECLQQSFGIGHFVKAARLAAMPALAGLVKIKTDPPRYRLTANGHPLTLDAKTLQQPARFVEAIFEALNVVMPMPKRHEWMDTLQGLVDAMTEEDAPLEAGNRGVLVLFLRDFLLMRTRVHPEEGPQAMLRGLPWLDEGTRRIFFRATDFADFLGKRLPVKIGMGELYSALVELAGLTFLTREIKGASVPLWSVPEPAHEQAEPFTVHDRAPANVL